VVLIIPEYLCYPHERVASSIANVGDGLQLEPTGPTSCCFAFTCEGSLHIPIDYEFCWGICDPQSLQLGTCELAAVRLADIVDVGEQLRRKIGVDVETCSTDFGAEHGGAAGQ